MVLFYIPLEAVEQKKALAKLNKTLDKPFPAIPAVFFKFLEYPRYGFIPEES